ncbi:MAG: hypothetical protein MRY83_03355 [Flavobacteriales bacterium]|nr:hypothetical protein [Flavobacteriales bacterium]
MKPKLGGDFRGISIFKTTLTELEEIEGYPDEKENYSKDEHLDGMYLYEDDGLSVVYSFNEDGIVTSINASYFSMKKKRVKKIKKDVFDFLTKRFSGFEYEELTKNLNKDEETESKAWVKGGMLYIFSALTGNGLTWSIERADLSQGSFAFFSGTPIDERFRLEIPDFNQIFNPNQKFLNLDFDPYDSESGEKYYTHKLTNCGEIHLESGSITLYGDKNQSKRVLAQKITPGNYPLQVICYDGIEICSFAKLKLSKNQSVKWVPATFFQDSIQKSGYFMGVNMESMKLIIGDSVFLENSKQQLETAEMGEKGYTIVSEADKSYAILSGFTGYKSMYWGIDADGNVAELIIDFNYGSNTTWKMVG